MDNSFDCCNQIFDWNRQILTHGVKSKLRLNKAENVSNFQISKLRVSNSLRWPKKTHLTKISAIWLV
jgi:hypothetical protein